MGAIEDVYEDLDADLDFEDFEASVREKVDQMGGLADEETAAMLVAHELDEAGGEVDGVADIDPEMDEAKFVAKVTRIGEVRTFERDGDDPDGRVVNVEAADETGRVTLAFWDDMADAVADGELEVGQVLRVAGRPGEGYDGVEVSVDRAEPDEDATIDVEARDVYRVEDLSLGLSDVRLRGQVLATEPVRTFDRDDGSEGRVGNAVLGDETGRVRLTLWDGASDRVTELSAGDCVEVVDGYTRERDGDLELHVGDRGAVEEIDEEVEYVPDTADIGSLELGQTADIAGGVVETSETRTFDRDDGSEGQVRNVRLKDETGEIRVALWGEKADADVDLGDHVLVTDAEIEDGWQDDLEASANWRSTVSVVDDAVAPTDAAGVGSGEPDSGSGQESDLSSFADGGSAATAATAEAAAEDADADANGDDPVSFTGTVVQTGDPVVVDDGQRTRTVETDADLRLGEQVTVRGPVRDDRIVAEDVTR